jgi:5'(3')-deoxyribonucleotidase
MANLMDLYKLINENVKSKYIIYCDLDGVLVDFDKGYKDLTGVTTDHANVQGKQNFWDQFNNSLKGKNISEYKYWSELEWESDGKQLWSYIKQYNPFILTAPTRNPESKEGKTYWVQNNIGPVRKLIFAYSFKKPEYSRKNHILIDDRQETIVEWNAKGGIGILHTSTQDTIKQLKTLGI